MATNYPTNLDSYTTKIDNSDDVLASHVNDLQAAVVALQTKLGVDSSVVSTSVDYFLKSSSGAFRTHTHDGTTDDGPKLTFSSVSEVAIAGLVNNQCLKYSTVSSKWVNATITLSIMGDVSFGTLTNGEALIYNSSSGKWINQSLSAYSILANTQTFTGLNTFSGGIVIETRGSDPTSPLLGQLWLRTDL